MSLIKSISGFRGTIGGREGDNLTPLDIVKFASAYAEFIKETTNKEKIKIILGRDARISGEMVSNLVVGALMGMGADIIDTGLSTTPTVEVAVEELDADGGIILTASHNPREWNALKLLNGKGEFINAEEGKRVLELAESADFEYADIDSIGSYQEDDTTIDMHIEKILALPLVDVELIKKKNFKIAVDSVNSTGGITVPKLLKALGVNTVVEIYSEPTGDFPHNPEPLPENIRELSSLVVENNCDLGIVVDPDVDRLALVCENGEPFGEEYTLVAISDYILSKTPGNTVSNMSSTRALRDITEKHGQKYSASAVGEVNVVELMKETNAVIGGEGNGGIIYPELHYGRDALVGIALFLTHLAEKDMSVSRLRYTYPRYFISKNKMELTEDIDIDDLFKKMEEKYSQYDISTIDGLKINFEDEWVHLRKSNTEPIIRIYSESDSETKSDHLSNSIINEISNIIREK